MSDDPVDPGTPWRPGSYTTTRCELWQKLTDDGKDRLTRYALREARRGYPAETELPDIPPECFVDSGTKSA